MNSSYMDFLKLFQSDLEFAKQYISVHYPFNYAYLIDNWPWLEAGDAHYCVVINDVDQIFPSQFGLSFNKNICWNSKLRARFDYGFDNPYMGYVDGTGEHPVEYDEKDYLDKILPLNKQLELENRNTAIISCTTFPIDSTDDEGFEPKTYDIEHIFECLSKLSFREFNALFKANKLKALLNESVWENTLRHIIDEHFCDIIIDESRKRIIESK